MGDMTEPTEPPQGHHDSSGTERPPAGSWEGQQPAQPGAWEYSPQDTPQPEHAFAAQGAAYPGGPGYQYGAPVTGSTFPAMPPLQTDSGMKRRGLSTAMVAVAILGGVIGGGVGVGGTLLLAGHTVTPVLTQHDSHPSTQPAAQAGSVQFAAGKALASTVDIEVASNGGGDEGTGVILTPDGYVLTNNHVVSSGGQITVTLPGERKVGATVVGVSPSYDLAVLKLGGVSGLTPAELGRSSGLVVGQTVVAVGSPLGLEGTVTSGIVSALNRTVQVTGDNGQAVVYNGLQTDASINPGNSGGPLVNLDGQVIGINSSIQSTNSGGGGGGQAGNIGLGFSIPIDTASRVANEIIQHGAANKPQLGIEGTDGQNGAATISQVLPGSAASKAGLTAGETILKVDDQDVNAFTDLIARISAQTPGATVTLTVADGQGKNPHPVRVTLGSVPDKAADTTSNPGQGFPGFGGGNGSPFGGGGGGFGGGGGGFGGGGGGGFGGGGFGGGGG
jgi:putative serine protease PepD